MSKKSEEAQMYPSAPSSTEDDFLSKQDPPSYDECIKMDGYADGIPHQYTYCNPTPNQQQQAFQPPPMQLSNCASPSSSKAFGFANPYETHIQQHQNFYSSITTTPSSRSDIPQSSQNILYFAEGAKIRTTATGAISVPPPPPGCSPTPGQIAAMSGQPVQIKKQKKTFF